jgi:hypothetical protein
VLAVFELIQALPIRVVVVADVTVVPLPIRLRPVNDADDPLNATVIAAVVLVARADKTKVRSV